MLNNIGLKLIGLLVIFVFWGAGSASAQPQIIELRPEFGNPIELTVESGEKSIQNSIIAQGDSQFQTEAAYFNYLTPEGGNLTYLSRHSLQVTSQQSPSISPLTAANLVAAETCLVGNFRKSWSNVDLVLVNQSVIIPLEAVNECVDFGANLTATQIQAWSAYLPIQEDLSNLIIDTNWALVNSEQLDSLNVVPQSAGNSSESSADSDNLNLAPVDTGSELASFANQAIQPQPADSQLNPVEVDIGRDDDQTRLGEFTSYAKERLRNYWYYWAISVILIWIAWRLMVSAYQDESTSFGQKLSDQVKRVQQSKSVATSIQSGKKLNRRLAKRLKRYQPKLKKRRQPKPNPKTRKNPNPPSQKPKKPKTK